MKRVRGTVSLDSFHPHQGGTAQCQDDALTYDFSQGKVRVYKYMPWLLSSMGCCQRGQVLSYLIQNTEVICTTEGQEEAGGIAASAQNSSKTHGSC